MNVSYSKKSDGAIRTTLELNLTDIIQSITTVCEAVDALASSRSNKSPTSTSDSFAFSPQRRPKEKKLPTLKRGQSPEIQGHQPRSPKQVVATRKPVTSPLRPKNTLSIFTPPRKTKKKDCSFGPYSPIGPAHS